MASRLTLCRSEFHRKTGKRLSLADERECLAQALQANAVYIVDNLNFNETDLPDQLISKGQITEDECSMIREMPSKKDRVRYLISRTKGRDFKDIEKVLGLISKQIPEIVDMIYEQFATNKDNKIRCKTCALCQCFNVIDVKDVADNLWSKQAISDGLYNEIVACTRPRGSQSELWRCVIISLNQQNNVIKTELFDSLFQTILTRGRFEFLVRPMQRSLHKRNILICECSPVKTTSYFNKIMGESLPSQSSSIPSSPRSSWSSAASIAGSDDTLLDTDIAGTDDDMNMGTLQNNAFSDAEHIFVSHVKQLADNCSITPRVVTEGKSSQAKSNSSTSWYHSITDEVTLRRRIVEDKRRPRYDFTRMQEHQTVTEKSKRHGRNLENVPALKPEYINDWLNIMQAIERSEPPECADNQLDFINVANTTHIDDWINILTSELYPQNSKRHGRNLDGVAAADLQKVDNLIKRIKPVKIRTRPGEILI